MNAQTELKLNEPTWREPALTRWFLVGEPGHALYLVSEYGSPDDPACAIDEPERPPMFGPRCERDDWLQACGIGVSPDHRDGIAGWAWWLTMEHDRDEAHDQAQRKAKSTKAKR